MLEGVYYITRDKKEHKTREKAVSHCLEVAHVKLTEVLREAECASPHLIAERVIDRASDRDKRLTRTYAQLYEVVSSLKDTLILED